MKNLLASLFLLFSSSLYAIEFEWMLEAGTVWQNRNDFQIPPTLEGTRVFLGDIDDGPFLHYRSELYARLSERHGVRLTVAPFSVSFNQRIDQPIAFQDTQFLANRDTDFNYTFNSYRLTYFYAFWGHGDRQLNLGLTAKIRQAEILVRQGALTQSFEDLGFVPLIYFDWRQPLSDNWALLFNFDGLAGGPGRAIDVALKLRRKLGDSAWLGLGYRTLEGGADNDQVFTYSWFNYAVADLVWVF